MKRTRSKLLVEVLSPTDETTKALAFTFGKDLKKGDVVCLKGDLGAGKTTFMKGIASAFGFTFDEITSPTFTYLHLIGPFAHFDLYRLKDEKEFIEKGFVEYFDPETITCIEWPGIIENLLPLPHYDIVLEHSKEKRNIRIERITV